MRASRLTAVLLVVTGPAGMLLAATPSKPVTPRQRLKREIPAAKVIKMPLMRVLRHYTQLSGLPIEADWTGLEIVGIHKETPVTLKAYRLSFEKLLDLTLDTIAPKNQPLAWYLSGGKVHVTTQMRAVLRNRFPIPALVGAAARPRPSGFRGVREISFDQTPLGPVIGFFRDVTGQNFHVNWRALEATNVTKDTPVTVKAKGISVARALDLVMDQLSVGRDRFSSVYWLVEGGVVKIATGEALNRTTKVRIYEVGDLLMVVPNFKGPRIELGRSQNGSNNTSSNGGGLFGDDDDDDDDTTEESAAEQRKRLQETLVEMIKMSIGDEMWAPTGKGSIKFLRDKMIISQTPLGFKLLQQAVAR